MALSTGIIPERIAPPLEGWLFPEYITKPKSKVFQDNSCNRSAYSTKKTDFENGEMTEKKDLCHPTTET